MNSLFQTEQKNSIGEALSELFRRNQRRFFRPSKTLLELFPDIVAAKGNLKMIPAELTSDSRKVGKDSVFFVPNPPGIEGAQFIPEAIARGALAVVTQSTLPFDLPVTTLQVPSLPHALSDAARRFFGMPDKRLSLIAVTGSKGKTTMAHMLRHILRESAFDAGMLSTLEYDLGGPVLHSNRTTPGIIDMAGYLARMVDYGCSHAIIEVSPHSISQGSIIGLGFETAIFNGLAASKESAEETYALWAKVFKGELGPPPKRAAINLDDPYGQRLFSEIHETMETITYGSLPACDLRADEMMGGLSGGEFTLRNGSQSLRGWLAMIGEKNIINALGAVAAAHSLGISAQESMEALKDFSGVPGRLERIHAGQPFEVIVDYAHTEETLRNCLLELRQMTKGRLITVFGCGGGHSHDKRAAITNCVMNLSDLSVATADNPRNEKVSDIFKMMQAGIAPGKEIVFIPSRREAITRAIECANAGDCILIAGKGHETTQEYEGRIVPFDDKAVARDVIRNSALA